MIFIHFVTGKFPWESERRVGGGEEQGCHRAWCQVTQSSQGEWRWGPKDGSAELKDQKGGCRWQNSPVKRVRCSEGSFHNGRKFKTSPRCCLSQGCRRKRLMWKSRGTLEDGIFLFGYLLPFSQGL